MTTHFIYRTNSLLSGGGAELDLGVLDAFFLGGNDRGSVAVATDGSMFISGTMAATGYNRGFVAKVLQDGSLAWAVEINDDSVCDNAAKGTAVASMVATAAGGVVCALIVSGRPDIFYDRSVIGLVELSSTGTVVRQTSYWHEQPAGSGRWAVALRPVLCSVAGGGYKMLGVTTAYYSGYAPLCASVSSTLAVSGASIWTSLYFANDFLGRYACPISVGATTAAFGPTAFDLVALIACKLSGNGLASGVSTNNVIPSGAVETSDGGMLVWGKINALPGVVKLTSTLAVAWAFTFGSSTAGNIAGGTVTPQGYCFYGEVDGKAVVFGLDSSGAFLWGWETSPQSLTSFSSSMAYMTCGVNGVVLATKRGDVTPSQLRVTSFPYTGEQGTCTIFGTATVLTPVAATTTWGTVSGSAALTPAVSHAYTPFLSVASIGSLAVVCSEATVVVDPPIPPTPTTPLTDRGILLVLNEDSGGWMVWRGLGEHGCWNPEENRPVMLGGSTLYRAWQRGGRFVRAFLTMAYSDLGNRDRIKSPRHLELDATGDGGTVQVDWEQDGVLQSSPVGTLTPTSHCYSTDVADGYYSSDGSGGVYEKNRPQIQRVWKGTAQRGELTRVTVSAITRLDLIIHRLFINFAVRNPPGGNP